jgi:AAA+ ATPase superfamily predicted ATPase
MSFMNKKKLLSNGLIGRTPELKALLGTKDKKTASFVVLWGRRRIGKSSLAEEFGSTFAKFYQFQGLGPREGQTNRDQLNYFSEKLQEYFALPQMKLRTWSEAFTVLSSQCQSDSVCILLDEISWLGGKDKDFAGRLKIAWDTQFKKNPKLVLVACGSVSAWIQKNILMQTDFVGRISLSIFLKELSISESNQFWTRNGLKIGIAEKLHALLLTGGVPKYLEEVAEPTPIAQQMARKCFTNSGFFFREFDRVFSDIFGRRTRSLRKLVQALTTQRLTASALARKLKKPLNGKFLEALDHLVISGFVERSNVFTPDGTMTDKVFYRVRDNYLRFYLRMIAPRKRVIEQGHVIALRGEDLPGWTTFIGQQFENLVYASLHQIFELLGINASRMVSSGAYIQSKNSRNKVGCQIDLLIHEQKLQYYICEIKSGVISTSLEREVQQKIAAVRFPRAASIRPVLICASIEEQVRKQLEETFYKIITFEDLL